VVSSPSLFMSLRLRGRTWPVCCLPPAWPCGLCLWTWRQPNLEITYVFRMTIAHTMLRLYFRCLCCLERHAYSLYLWRRFRLR